MRVYRGPKSKNEIEITDELSLSDVQNDIRPEDSIWIDINVDKESSKLSSACITFSESDFELMHENYIKHLKDTIKKQKEVIELNEKGWQSLTNYMNNTEFIDYKKNEIVNFVINLSERVMFGMHPESSVLDVKSYDFKITLDEKGLLYPVEAAEHCLKIINYSTHGFEEWASEICGSTYFFEKENGVYCKRILGDFKKLIHILQINNDQPILCSTILIKLIESMKKNDLIYSFDG